VHHIAGMQHAKYGIQEYMQASYMLYSVYVRSTIDNKA
jgi:hypothetical protein